MRNLKFETHQKYLPVICDCCIDEIFEVKKINQTQVKVEITPIGEDEDLNTKTLMRFLIELGSKVPPDAIIFV